MSDGHWRALSELVWWPTTVLLLFAVGTYLTLGLRAFPWRRLVATLAALRDDPPVDRRRVKGEISPLQALMTTLGAELGAGSIVGVATAIHLGGPGAVFWMWATGVVGMAIKYAEVVLAVHHRERGPGGHWVGGPMYYIQNGLGPGWRWLALLFAGLAAGAAFGLGNLVQANSFAGALEVSLDLPRWLAGGVCALLAGLVIVGGLPRVSVYAQHAVPLAAGLYVTGALAVLTTALDRIPGALAEILTSAFTGTAAGGGVVGGSVWLAIHFGVARATFSSEAGLGTASIVHATARTTSPVQQGLIAASGLFVNLFGLCTLTALVILCTGSWLDGGVGTKVSTAAFTTALGSPWQLIVPMAVALFSFNCMVAFSCYGEACAQYLLGGRIRLPYRLLWVVAAYLGAVNDVETVWLIADLMNGLMALPNLLALLLLGRVVFRLTRAELRPGAAPAAICRRPPWVRGPSTAPGSGA